MPTKKRRRYKDLSLENLRRLQSIPCHNSSWQSRLPDFDHWGGAIRASDCIFSFYGLPELANEATMLASAVMLLLLTYEQACAIAKISNNHYFLTIGVLAFIGQRPEAIAE